MPFENRVRDNSIDEILRIEGLLAYAVEHGDETEIRRLKALLDRAAEKDA